MITGTLAADPHILAARLTGLDRAADQGLHGWITFVKGGGYQTRVAVQAQRELSQVVGSDGETVEMIKERIGEHSIGRKLAHHDHFQAVVTSTKSVLGQQIDHTLGLREGT